jgi:GT2 family glycosyltransferase
MSDHDVAVVLVNWRGADDTLGCLAAIAALEAPRPLSIVIENGSGDASAAMLRAASDLDILIESPVNLGFGGGCNLGIARARAEGARFVWLLNNDARPEASALSALMQVALADPLLGAVGSLMHETADPDLVDGYNGGVIDFRTGQCRRSRNADEMQFLSGASLLLRLDALAAIGDFDEGFFLYWEDADLGFRLRAAGWRLAIADGSHVRHAVSASARKAGRDAIRYFNDGAIRFYRRYAPVPLIPLLANFLYRFLGQLHAGEFANALTILLITLRIDRVRVPKVAAVPRSAVGKPTVRRLVP